MDKELELWEFIAKRLAGGAAVMLLVVAESAGSSPGRQGFKMAVAEDGLCGSIGGGVMEVALVERAREQLAAPCKPARITEQVHRLDAPNASGMICSGRQSVISLSLGPADLDAVREVIGAIGEGTPGAIRISRRGFQFSAAIAVRDRFESDAEGDFVYEERLPTKDRLYLIGGGHCALALSELMSKLGFRISLFDDRTDLNTLEKNVYAHQKTIIDSYDDIGGQIPPDPDGYVVVMTLGYAYDVIVIRNLIDRDFRYFGVLGSRAKMKTMLRELESDGISRERLARLRAPVGIPINSRTPEEIAVSIAAEIIKVRNGV